jgi:hypothetical protein
MDLTVREETFEVENRTWLASEHGFEVGPSITLDISAFTEADHYPDGHLPSGVVLGKISASGFYGPYDDAATDGREVAAGLLKTSTSVRNSSNDLGGALLVHGFVVEDNLPIASGTPGSIDAAGKSDLSQVEFF